MSKQSEAKERQGYNPKPSSKTCMNCIHYISEIEFFGVYDHEINKRCSLGGFAVKKTAVCNEFSPIPA